MKIKERRILDYFYADIDVRSRSFRWSTLGIILDNGVARALYLLPVVGYVLLYSDFFSSVFSFSILPRWGFLTFFQRLNLIYYGSCLLLFSYGLYFLYCPPLLRGRQNVQHFAEPIIAARDSQTMRHVMRDIVRVLYDSVDFSSTDDRNEMIELSRQIRDLVMKEDKNAISRYSDSEFNGPFPLLLHFYFNYQNQTLPAWRITIFTIAIFAYILLALPALDLFVRVLAASIHHWFA